MRLLGIACLFVVLVSVCAAQPFDKVPLDSADYAQLAQLDVAHLLGGYSLPDGELSRLEIALLVQTALRTYADQRLSGAAADPDAEAALGTLASGYSQELVQLGGAPAVPAQMAVEAPAETAPEPVEAAAEEPVAEPEPAISTSLYGNVYLQTRFRQTRIDPGADESFGDVDIYWGELGVTTSFKDWSGKFSVLLDDATETVLLNETWARYQHIGCCDKASPWFFQVGKILVPFGNNTYYFPTYPAVNDLSYRTLHAVGGGYDSPSQTVSVYAYNSRAEVAGDDNGINDYSAVWDIAKRDHDECRDGYKLTVGYDSNLAAGDLRIAGDDVESRVPAVNLFGRYDFNDDGQLVHVLADYTYATTGFDPADLDANADGVGDQPAALNTELVLEPKADRLYGVSYQQTDELQDYAETRWGLLYGQRLNELAKFKLEYTHGEFGAFATGGQQSDDTLVAEINLAF